MIDMAQEYRKLVSIRSRPGGREIPNSTPREVDVKMFQSAPGPEAGRYVVRVDSDRTRSSFNPLPARRPGDTAFYTAIIYNHVLFQSAPGPEAGRYCECVCPC